MSLQSILAACLALVAVASSSAQSPVAKTILLNVSKDQLPPDIGSTDKTKPEIVDDFKGLGGKALKVPFDANDSFGAKAGANSNWKRQEFFRFDAFNPLKGGVVVELDVIHARSTNFNTRVVIPITLKPGRNEVKIGIAGMKNENGSVADLAHVERWYIADVKGVSPTVYFSDIWLEGGEPPAVTSARSATGTAHGDPARLARIKAAKMPKITRPISFDTPEADAILSALEVFPENNPWNLVVSDWPLHPKSKAIVASIGADKPLRYNPDMGFILAPPDQKKVDVKVLVYPAESDKGPFPVPDAIPIEGWPVVFAGKNLTLDDVQRNKLNENSDRHALVVDPTNRMLYEFYQLQKTNGGWQATQASIFDLKSNKMRPEEWTSTDAAGLPVFPSVVRYDELKRGIVEHAMRVTVTKSRKAYVYPARHFASPHTDQNLPRMGERLRLRQEFDISAFSPECQAILKGLKKYGMFVADNGLDWTISVAPDPRIPVLHDELRKLKGSDFEVVEAPRGYEPPQ